MSLEAILLLPESVAVHPQDGDTPIRVNAIMDSTDHELNNRRLILRLSKGEALRLIEDLAAAVKEASHA